jgi:hypothetical protein
MQDVTDRQGQDFGFWRELEARFRRHPGLRPARRAFRRVKRFVPNAWRLATQHSRALPSVLIIGAQKAGTTQLHLCLTRHPRCFGGAKKELHYFTKHRDRPLGWYRSHFPFGRTVGRVDGLCLESTPSYLPSPQALQRMGEVLPEAKLIVLLRDPVTRAFSHYQHYKSRGLEKRDFATVVRQAIEEQAYAPQFGEIKQANAAPLLNYVHRGYYALQLEILFDYCSRQRVLVLDSANLFDNTNDVCQRTFDFLDLEPYDVSPKKIHNRGYYRDLIDPTVAQMLREHYQPHDELLVELLGRRFRWMEVDNVGKSRNRAA